MHDRRCLGRAVPIDRLLRGGNPRIGKRTGIDIHQHRVTVIGEYAKILDELAADFVIAEEIHPGIDLAVVGLKRVIVWYHPNRYNAAEKAIIPGRGVKKGDVADIWEFLQAVCGVGTLDRVGVPFTKGYTDTRLCKKRGSCKCELVGGQTAALRPYPSNH